MDTNRNTDESVKYFMNDFKPKKDNKLLAYFVNQMRNCHFCIVSQIKENTSMLEMHNSIILKHETMLKDIMKETVFDARIDIIRMEIFERVESIVRQMKNDIYEQLTSKINKDDFIISLKEKLSKSDFSKTSHDVEKLKERVKIAEGYIDDHRSKSDLYQKSIEAEIMNLTDQKVDKSTFDNLCSQVDRIEGMIEQLDSEFYSEAEESEDSIVEDVLSLNSIDNSEDHNDGLKEQTKNSSDETPKEDHSHNIPK